MSIASILSGVPAGLAEYARANNATIPLLATVIAVADTRITATSVVVCWGVGARDANATTFTVDALLAGIGFSIYTDAAPGIAKVVGYAVIKY